MATAVGEQIFHSLKGRISEVGRNHRTTCPTCSHRRKSFNQKEPCLSVKIEDDRIVWNCHHCDDTGYYIHTTNHFEKRQPMPDRDIKKAKSDNPISEKDLGYLKSRGISEEALKKYGVFSTNKFFRKAEKELEAIGFPYRNQQGEIYASKYRAVNEKLHTQEGTGGCQTLWGIEHLTDQKELIICEGEIDALSISTALPEACVVSVPNGAPLKISNHKVEPEEDRKFNYVWSARDKLKQVEKIIIAGDMDEQGSALGEELARRIGKVKCWTAKWPKGDGIKDANDCLVKGGVAAVVSSIKGAQPWPIAGLRDVKFYEEKLIDLYEKGHGKGESTGFRALDELYSVVSGQLTVVTGIPSSGKSEMIDAFMINLARDRGWKFCVCSFENDPATHIAKLAEKYLRRPFFEGATPRMSREELKEATDFINSHFAFIDHNDGEPCSVDSIMERAQAAVLRLGVRGLVIDPYNYLEIKRGARSETEAISDMLTKVRLFARHHDLHVFFVAHPTKLPRENGKVHPPRGMDISGSAHWFSKCDCGVTVHRELDPEGGYDVSVKFIVWKMRYKWVGKLGEATLGFDVPTGCYIDQENADSWKDYDL
jgi:twinkle protein